ncbi:hypothetical protein OAP14_08210 [Aliiglaciecola sp.]|nr:hypothetical protein [Aliiglaciecola sp.]
MLDALSLGEDRLDFGFERAADLKLMLADDLCRVESGFISSNNQPNLSTIRTVKADEDMHFKSFASREAGAKRIGIYLQRLFKKYIFVCSLNSVALLKFTVAV